MQIGEGIKVQIIILSDKILSIEVKTLENSCRRIPGDFIRDTVNSFGERPRLSNIQDIIIDVHRIIGCFHPYGKVCNPGSVGIINELDDLT